MWQGLESFQATIQDGIKDAEKLGITDFVSHSPNRGNGADGSLSPPSPSGNSSSQHRSNASTAIQGHSLEPGGSQDPEKQSSGRLSTVAPYITHNTAPHGQGSLCAQAATVSSRSSSDTAQLRTTDTMPSSRAGLNAPESAVAPDASSLSNIPGNGASPKNIVTNGSHHEDVRRGRGMADSAIRCTQLESELTAAKATAQAAQADLAAANVTIAEMKAEMNEMDEHLLGSGEVDAMQAQVKLALSKISEAVTAKEVAEARAGESKAAVERALSAQKAAESAAQVRALAKHFMN